MTDFLTNISFYHLGNNDLQPGSGYGATYLSGDDSLKAFAHNLQLVDVSISASESSVAPIDILVVEDSLEDIKQILSAISKCCERAGKNRQVGVCYSTQVLERLLSLLTRPPTLITMDFELDQGNESPTKNSLDDTRRIIDKLSSKWLLSAIVGITNFSRDRLSTRLKESLHQNSHSVYPKRNALWDLLPEILENLLAVHTLKQRLEVADDLRIGRLSSFQGMIGQSELMNQVYRKIKSIASNDIPVHITGERGTGKERVARAIHAESIRDGEFIGVNTPGLGELVMSELFGHVQGAFNQAITRKGWFHKAEGGTIFFDEIADLDLKSQVGLLRPLQEKEFYPVGSDKLVQYNVRIMSGTNHNLEQLSEERTFSRELYDRLNGIRIWLPPLRERRGDIPLLINFFCEKFNYPHTFEPKHLRIFEDYEWPGNVRELENFIKSLQSPNEIAEEISRLTRLQSVNKPESNTNPGGPVWAFADFVKHDVVSKSGKDAGQYYLLRLGFECEETPIMPQDIYDHMRSDQVPVDARIKDEGVFDDAYKRRLSSTLTRLRTKINELKEKSGWRLSKPHLYLKRN